MRSGCDTTTPCALDHSGAFFFETAVDTFTVFLFHDAELYVREILRMDTLGFEPRAFRMRSGCDTTTPCALDDSGVFFFETAVVTFS